MEKNPWKTLSSKEVYNNKWITVTEDDVINPGGGKGIYGKVHFKNLAIGIVAMDAEHHLWLVGQYRYTLNTYSWEIPEGGCPIMEDPLNGAKRELKEETGLVAREWMELFRMHLSNSVSDELAIIYFATDLLQEEAEPEETEDLRIQKVSLEKAYHMVENGEIMDSMSVAAITKIKLMQLQGKLI
ncbi:NUDIX domain-containing protein [Sediminibacterium goheungense]|uniref:GDP-mannose pyrophosphatase n=1 Tax=Sediminibacterium goheungense TaxID=1086393 RepID=A0A4R6J227_9BACT|nr:NUDIX hydrolase [Sediminibacterium goheungense]TDO28316.1 NUDIX domain-containing protein [Sediminibacterium goheungense]